MNIGNKRGIIGREKESLSQIMDFITTGGSAKSRMIMPVVFLALICLSTTALGVGSISGRVFKHSDNNPLQYVGLELYQGVDENIADQHAWEWVQHAQTHADGYYQFTNLPQRRYRICIHTQEPFGSNTHFVETNLYNIQVLDGANTGDMDFKLRQAARIWGYIKTTSGIPLSSAWVISDVSWTNEGWGWHNDWTDETGMYELWVLPSPGKFYPVWVRNAMLPGTTYKVYGGPVILWGEDGYDPDDHGYTFLGSGTTTKTFTYSGTYNYYAIVTDDGYVANVDAVEGPAAVPYWAVSSASATNTGNVYGLPPDGNFSRVGDEGWGLRGGYIIVQSSLATSTLTVHIADDTRGANPVPYESKWEPGNLVKAEIGVPKQVDYSLEAGGAVTGRVLTEFGEPIRDARVVLSWNKYGDFGDEVYTGSDGYYTIGGLTVGNDNYVCLDNNWREMQHNNVKYMAGEAYRGPINITTGGELVNITDDFTVYKTGMVTGVVTDENGDPVVGAEVEVQGRDIDGNWSEREDAVTGAFGQYTLDYITPGTYFFRCEKPGYITTIIPDIVVKREQQVDLDVVLKSGAKGTTVSGKITNYSAVAAYDSDNSVYYPCYEETDYEEYGLKEFGLIALPMDRTYTDEDFLDIDALFVGELDDEDIDDEYGDYFEPNATESRGNYTMSLPPGEAAIGMYIDNPEILPGWGGSVILHDWKIYNLTEGDSKPDVDFTAYTGNTGKIKGSLIVPSGYDNFAGDWCVIFAYSLAGTPEPPLFDAVAFAGWTNKYEFVNMPVGNYQLRVFARNLPSVVVQPVTVSSGLTTTQDINLASEPSGSLSGQITSSGSPVEGAMVTIVEKGRQAITDSSGNYTITGINTGTYTVKVTASGFADAQQDNVNINTGSNTLNFSLSSEVGSISGTVKDDGGNNVNGATVVAYNENDYTHKTGQTVGGAFTVTGLTPGQYVLSVDAGIYGVVIHPDSVTLAANENKTGINIVVGTPEPPLFTVTSSVNDNGGTILSMEFYSDQGLKDVPLVTKVEGDGSLGGLTSNSALNRFNIDYTADAGDTIVKFNIEETDPLIPGNKASKLFSFDVSADLSSSTNVTNATGGTASIMGTQDNTEIYVPPFAIAGVGDDTEAIALTIERYGDPGQTVPGTTGSTASAIYDFEFDKEGVTIDINHTFTVTMSFTLPAGMSEEVFEDTLELRYFDAGDQEWKTDGISNVSINFLSKTIKFDVSHLTKFAAFVEGVCCHPADSITACDNVINILEILAYIDKWADGDVTILEVLEGIDLWAAGQYYCDQDGKYIPGEKPGP